MTDIPQLPEFIFGSLSTKEGRLKQARIARLGFYHDSVLEPPDPRPGEPITISVRVGAEIAITGATLLYTTDRTSLQIPPDLGNPSVSSVPMARWRTKWDTLQWSHLEEWRAQIPGQPVGTRVQYVIQGTTTQGQSIYSPFTDTGSRTFRENRNDFDPRLLEKLDHENWPHIYEFGVDQERIPGWLREAVIYQIFVERFAPDPGSEFRLPVDRSGFYGGTLRGITSRLDYLSDLGVTCLWMTPIFPSPSHHGYDPTDYGTVEPRLGTDADFQTLLDEAHQRGIRILLDFVANHCSNQHPAFIAAQRDRASSTYPWFRFKEWPAKYESYYDVPGQPKLNSDHPEVRTYLFENAGRWLRRGVDGFRLDHAHGSTHAFWSAFRAATRAIDPESATLGEVTETPAFVRSYTGRMDACLDFRLLELLRAFFVSRALTASESDKHLRQHFDYFGDDLVLPTFLDNHDMNRFLWAVAGDRRRLRLAAMCQFTLPGPPIIYYGTEVGLSQLEAVGPLEEARLPMLWADQQDRALLIYYRDLIALRRQNQATWGRPRKTLLLDDGAALYGYQCGELAIFLNNGSSETTVTLSDWPGARLLFASELPARLNDPGGRLFLPPFGGAICKLIST